MTTPGAWKTGLIAACAAVVVAISGALVTELGPWYYGLRKPAFQPPDWLFGPAWTLIFGLAAFSGAVAWLASPNRTTRGWILGLFGFNIFLNILWSLLFFRLKRPDWALFESYFLWASVAALILALFPRSKLAAGLLVPYLAWVTFATVLNMAIVQLNAPFGAS